MPFKFRYSPVLDPLKETNGLIWPYTPQIYVTHSAAYTPIKPVHSNYPFFAYQNSQVDQFSITGDFLVENLRGIRWQSYDRSIDVLVSRLRLKLGDTPSKTNYIKTVHGVGYMFIGEPQNKK